MIGNEYEDNAVMTINNANIFAAMRKAVEDEDITAALGLELTDYSTLNNQE
ncbi:MAG: hypothetical protein GX213_04540 [Clostridiaceae bacterium]|nr:hypothetical protein [Clostridiaceae bacterium]